MLLATMRSIGRAIVAATLAANAAADEVVRNWFKDPYFQVRSGFAGCPVPLGPYTTHEQMLRETHYRSERGTRCWLEKKCSKPNSYMYDADIAAAVRGRFERTTKLRDASLWVTVQRRFVWIEGCATSKQAEREIEKLLRGVPDIDRSIVFVYQGKANPPYHVLAPGQKRED